MLNGFVNVLKPVGATASDVVVKLKHIFGQSKVGHLGTLDPGACGVLPIALGKATKMFDYLTDKQKKYRAFFTFGKTTDTLDAYGKLTATGNLVDQHSVCEALKGFEGQIMQLPPQYSAISVGGVRAYDLARQGVEVKLKERAVTIYNIELVRSYDNTFVVDIVCSAGTYIRSLARDIAQALGTVGYMSGLIRLYSGCFDIADAYTLDEIAQLKSQCIKDITYPLSDLKNYAVDAKLYTKLDNGVKLRVQCPFEGKRKIYCDNQFFGIGSCKEGLLTLDYYLKDV